MTPGQLDIDECISIAEHDGYGTCDECPDPASCQAEGVCVLELSTSLEPASQWDRV